MANNHLPFLQFSNKNRNLAVFMMLLQMYMVCSVDYPDSPPPEYEILGVWDRIITTRNPKDVPALLDYMGFNYAGASEFPWLVDIRTIDGEFDPKNKDRWGVGSLISSRYVITACAVVADHVFLGGYPTVPLLKLRNKDAYKVLFASTFLYDKDSPLRIGTRYIHRMSAHPDCDLQYIVGFQFGMIELERAVIPSPPFVSYLPVHYDPVEMNHWIYLTQTNHWIQCAVGTWGRTYNFGTERQNVENMLTHYKVRIRVMIIPLKECREAYKYYHCEDAKCEFPSRLETNLYHMRCMQVVNEPFAHVCHQDEGASVVCRETVNQESLWMPVGIVTAAARGTDCDPRYPRPFIVDTMLAAAIYYQNLSPYNYFDKPNFVKERT